MALACVVFVAGRIRSAWDEASDALTTADLRWVAASMALGALGMTAIAVPWRAVLASLGVAVTTRTAVSLYFVGEIGKYVPGGLWPVIGRGELISRRGVSRRASYASVLISLATLYLAALFLAVGLVPFSVTSSDGTPIAVWLVLVLPVGVVALHPGVLGFGIRILERLTKRTLEMPLPSWGTMLRLVSYYVPAWILIGTATWALVRAVGGDASWGMVCATTALSWAAGFLVAPVPGGVGVREAVFVAVVPDLDSGIAALVAVMARLVFVLVDAGGAVIAGAVVAVAERD